MTQEHDDEQWGNIELPGLSDAELFKKNWNHVAAAKSRMQNAETRKKLSESISKKQSDPIYLEHMSRQRLAALDKPSSSGNTLREKLTNANRLSAINPEHYANRCAANKRMKNDPKWKEAHAKGVLSYSEETMTPMGIFPSMSHWITEYNKPGGRSFLKSLPHLFYQTKVGPGKPTYERIYYTPFGLAASDRHAYKLARQNTESNSIKMVNEPGWWLKMASLFPDEYYISFEIAKYWPNEEIKPYGIDDLETKPRISSSKLQSIIDTWNRRLDNSYTKNKK